MNVRAAEIFENFIYREVNMDPFELLKKDHETVSDLFKRIESASGKTKLQVFQLIKSELELHTHIEETIFYPVLEKAKETRDLTLEAYEEHKVVKNLLGELDAAREVSDEWEAKLTVLRENVEHHVDEEENELFDKANDVLTGEEAESLGDRMQAEKVKRGAPASSVTSEKPGLLRKIANALGVGASSPEASKGSSKKKAKKKKGGKVAAKSAPSKSTDASAAKKGSGAGKGKGSSGINSAPAKRAAKKVRTGKRPAAKKTSTKETRRGR